MIESIETKSLWAQSLSDKHSTRTVTIYIGKATPRPLVTAQINLSRLQGSGTARAVIWAYETWGGLDSEPITHPIDPPSSTSDPNWLIAGKSEVTFGDAYSVTFGLAAINMFAYANCSVFIYQRKFILEAMVKER